MLRVLSVNTNKIIYGEYVSKLLTGYSSFQGKMLFSVPATARNTCGKGPAKAKAVAKAEAGPYQRFQK